MNTPSTSKTSLPKTTCWEQKKLFDSLEWVLILMLRRSVLWDLWHEGVWSSGWYSTRQSRLAVSCHEVYGRGGAFLNFIPLPLLQVIQESVDDSLPLLAHLIKPVQRVIKYKQFLEVSQFKFSMQSLIVQFSSDIQQMIKYSSKGKEQQGVQKGAKKEYFDKLKVHRHAYCVSMYIFLLFRL